MASVYVNNLIVNSGSDFSQTFTLGGSETNSSFDLTQFSAKSQMRKWEGSSNVIDFIAEILSPPSSGKINIRLTSEQTSILKPGRYVYDLIIEDSSGVKNRVIEGMVLVREGVTK